jgi:hypothetical protein
MPTEIKYPRFGLPTIREVLLTNKTFFVRPNGNDNNDGLSVNNPFLTIPKAIDRSSRLDFNGYTVTINVLGGYSISSAILFKDWVGSGSLIIDGNSSESTIITYDNNADNGENSGPQFCFWASGNLKPVIIQNVKLVNNRVTAVGHQGLIKVDTGGTVHLKDIDFGSNANSAYGGHLVIEGGRSTTTFLSGSNYKISGGRTGTSSIYRFIFCRSGASVNFSNPFTATVTNNINFSYFFEIYGGTLQAWLGSTTLGTYFNKQGFTVTGQRYLCDANGTFVHFGGSGFYSTRGEIPGTIAGVTNTGSVDA